MSPKFESHLAADSRCVWPTRVITHCLPGKTANLIVLGFRAEPRVWDGAELEHSLAQAAGAVLDWLFPALRTSDEGTVCGAMVSPTAPTPPRLEVNQPGRRRASRRVVSSNRAQSLESDQPNQKPGAVPPRPPPPPTRQPCPAASLIFNERPSKSLAVSAPAMAARGIGIRHFNKSKTTRATGCRESLIKDTLLHPYRGQQTACERRLPFAVKGEIFQHTVWSQSSLTK